MDPWLETFARANFRRSADTAHDLKTPLNVAVLSLELLRMRLRKIGAGEDEKVLSYAHAIEAELRRLGQIFDAFFLLSTPPKNEEAPVLVDIVPIAADAGFALQNSGSALVLGHETRIRQALSLFFQGGSKILLDREAAAALDAPRFTVTLMGTPAVAELELTKVFKFYYTDIDGNPDLSLALARLITETYGGELIASMERDKVILRLAFPLGDQ